MSDKKLGAISPEEADLRLETMVHAKIDALVAQHEQKTLGKLAQAVASYEQPIREDVPETRPAFSAARLEVPWRSEYRRLPEFEQKIRTPDTDHWMAEWLRAVAVNDRSVMALADDKLRAKFPDMYRADTLEGTANSSGGFAGGTGATLLPRPLEQLVAVARDRVAKMARFATVYQMTAQEHNIPTGAAVTSFMLAEATATSTQGEPTWAQVPLVAYNAVAECRIGNDLLADAAVNVVSFITMRGGTSLGALEDQEFFKTGTGSSPHVTKISGTTTTATTAGALDYSTVIRMYSDLQQEYRDGAVWFIAPNVLRLMSNVRDDLSHRPFYESLLERPNVLSDTPGAVGTLLGKPVVEVPFTPGTIWFGDPAAVYAIGRREGITVDVSRDFLFTSRKTVYLIRERFAGNNIDLLGASQVTGITSASTL